MESSYKLTVTTPGKVIIYRNRPIRTPANFMVTTSQELEGLRAQLRALGSKDYRIEIVEPVVKGLGFTNKEVEEIIGDPVIEEAESNSLLDKLLREN